MKRILILFICFPVFSQTFSTVTDICGNTYQTVEIGDLEWMTEYFKCTKFLNGNDIPLNPVNFHLQKSSMGLCNGVAIYQADVIWNTNGFGIDGWRVPTESDFNNLYNTIGGDFNKVKEGGETGLNLPVDGVYSKISTDDSQFDGCGSRGYFYGWVDKPRNEFSTYVINYEPGNSNQGPEKVFSVTESYVTNWKGIQIRLVRDKQTASIPKIKSNISIYPNPTNNILNIDFNDYKSSELFSIDGKSVLKSTLKQIDLSKEVKGIYFLVIEDINGVKSNGIKVIKE